MVNKIHDIMLADRRVKIREIANIVKISTERIQNVLHETLGMKKLSARWVPRLLTVEQKRNRMTTSKHCLDMFKCNPKEFLRRFVTVDGFTITHQKRKNSLNSGLNPANLLQRRQNGSIGRKDRHHFLGFAKNHFHRLFGEGKDNHGTVLC